MLNGYWNVVTVGNREGSLLTGWSESFPLGGKKRGKERFSRHFQSGSYVFSSEKAFPDPKRNRRLSSVKSNVPNNLGAIIMLA